jgi:transcriptional regulator GlxA family with amidase domain
MQRNADYLKNSQHAETNFPGEKIAELAGFGSPAYLGDIFRREKGIAPTQFVYRMTLP